MRLYLNNKIKSNTDEICHSVILVWTGVYLLNTYSIQLLQWVFQTCYFEDFNLFFIV